MTECLKLIEMNEIRQIRITCNNCGTALKIRADKVMHVKRCPECDRDFEDLYNVMFDLKELLKRRADIKNFQVHIELSQNIK